jgi:kelch-like protein 19
MDGEDDDLLGQSCQNTFDNFAGGLPFDLGDDKDTDSSNSTTEKHGDPGDMKFCMNTYIKGVMKMMYIMRSHNMLTDVILEVGTEIFHAHKVILAAASPYFKVTQYKTRTSL